MAVTVQEEVLVAEGEASTGRSRVLDAAASLFVAQGYAGTTLRQIASAAGIKAGSIYHHFDSKEDLFVAVLDAGITVMIDAFETTSASLPLDPSTPERVHAHVRAHLGAVFEHGPYTTAHVTSFFSAPASVRERVVPRRDDYERQWSEMLGESLSRSAAVPSAPESLRLHRLILFGAMNSSAEWFDPSGDTTLDELAQTITSQFLHGVLGDQETQGVL